MRAIHPREPTQQPFPESLAVDGGRRRGLKPYVEPFAPLDTRGTEFGQPEAVS